MPAKAIVASQAEDREPLAAGQVYVARPDHHLQDRFREQSQDGNHAEAIRKILFEPSDDPLVVHQE